MQAVRTSDQIKSEIEKLFGFFPNFFQPVLDSPEALETLWQQTLSAYVNNPLPALFKEKLFARLSRYCVAPYCFVTHSCLMRFLGQSAAEISSQLEAPAPTTEDDIGGALHILSAQTGPLAEWPAPNSSLEHALLRCAEVTFLNTKGVERCRAELRRLLGTLHHTHLIRFLSHVRLAHLWIEAYPEISYQADERTMKLLGTLVQDQPRLAEFFNHYPEIVKRERESREEQLSNELATLKQVQEELLVSEERYRTLVESAPDAILVMDVDSGRFVDANENSLRLFGLERDELFKRGPVDLSSPMAPDGRPASELAAEKIEEAISGGTPAFEWIHRNSSGQDIHCEVRLMRMPGSRNLVRGSITDITERKRAEEDLRRYARRLKTLQEIDRAILAAGSPAEIARAALHHLRHVIPFLRASVMVWDDRAGEGTLYAVDSQREVKLGVGTRLPLEAFGGDEVRNGKVHIVNDVLSQPESPFVESLKAEGLRSWMNVPLISQERLIGTLNLGWDRPGTVASEHIEIAREVADSLAIAIQQARLHEEVQRHAGELERRVAARTAELEAFSYSVSHDLRTPLLTIDGFARMLLEDYADKVDDEGQRLLRTICTNSQNMSQLIDDLLAFSRLGQQEMRPTKIDMEELAAAAFRELEPQASDRAVRFTLGHLPPAQGDAAMLRQVFLNLISNAIKFTAVSETAVLTVGSRTEGTETVYFVKDNGVGFDMKYVDKLFGVFQRLHPDEQFAGTGVGLAFVKRIIDRHGGRVWAEGEVNKGATIYFALPRKEERPW